MEDGQGPVFQAQLKAVGIDVKFEEFDVGTAIGAWNEGKHNIGEPFFFWNDPNVLGFLMGTGSGLNWVKSADPKLDAMFDKGNSTTDPAVRKAAYLEAQKYIASQAFVVPTFGKSEVFAFVKNLSGWSWSPTGYPIWDETYYAK
jgi:peptide/nickel transport system substrate-binding protein